MFIRWHKIHPCSYSWHLTLKQQELSSRGTWKEHKPLSNRSRCTHRCRCILTCLSSGWKTQDMRRSLFRWEGSWICRHISLRCRRIASFCCSWYRRRCPWTGLRLYKHIFCRWCWRRSWWGSRGFVCRCRWLCRSLTYRRIRRRFRCRLVGSWWGRSSWGRMISSCSRCSLGCRRITFGFCLGWSWGHTRRMRIWLWWRWSCRHMSLRSRTHCLRRAKCIRLRPRLFPCHKCSNARSFRYRWIWRIGLYSHRLSHTKPPHKSRNLCRYPILLVPGCCWWIPRTLGIRTRGGWFRTRADEGRQSSLKCKTVG